MLVLPHTQGVGSPSPEGLMCSLTLPGEPHTAVIARAATRSALHAHGLDAVAPAVVQVVGELCVAAYRVAPGRDVYLALRYRDGNVRLTTYDAGPRPTHPRLAAACDTRRRAGLRVLSALVKACGGTWGVEPSREPGGGTRTWVALPHGAAAAW